MRNISPQVSVIIPAYNQARYLAEAIESALAQSFTDREIIVVDDGSTDHTAAIAKRFGNAIGYIYQENQGLASARNTGIRRARGELVALLDSDDAWLPNFLAELVRLATVQPQRAVFYSGVCYMDAEGSPLPQRGAVAVLSPAAFRRKLLRSNFLVPSAILMRRQAVLEAGLFDIRYRRLQDWELWVRMVRLGYTFTGVAHGLVRYRIHQESLSTDPDGGERAALALAAKHVGPDDEQHTTWEADKRTLYGGVYRYIAVTSSLLRRQDWQRCAHYLARALRVDPTLATSLELFYELVLGAQPLGQRTVRNTLGEASQVIQLERLLAAVVAQSNQRAPKLLRAAYGTAFFALGLVSYHRHEIVPARRHLLRALRYSLALLRKPQFVGTLLRTLVGRTILTKLRQAAQQYRQRRTPIQVQSTSRILPWR